MTEEFTGWETTRLSKHFILLDFLADREVYRPYDGSMPLPFDDTWNCQHEALAKGLCGRLLEPLMKDKRVGPISVADAFVPSVIKTKHKMKGHGWAEGEATVDIAPYRLVDDKGAYRLVDARGTYSRLKEAVLSIDVINNVNGDVEPRIFGERALVGMGGLVRALAVGTGKILLKTGVGGLPRG